MARDDIILVCTECSNQNPYRSDQVYSPPPASQIPICRSYRAT